jgi:ribose 5-phosphate isomerase B
MKRTIGIGSDHAGFSYKERFRNWLLSRGFEVRDFGTDSEASADYPDFAHAVASAVEEQKVEVGVLVCGSANGVAITANKHQGIRAAICWTEELAELARKHNNANIVCIPARFIEYSLGEKIVDTFLHSEFEGGRHASRVNKISC